MKTKFLNIVFSVLFGAGSLFAQDVTTVRANNSDISDNLDLKAVASIFGDSRDLEDFERRLNDPDIQISNLDLNGDGRVDYLRVVELAQGNTHVIVLQSVLGPDTFQDIATIEVERDRHNNVTVQVVGDVYMYGSNYIYQPVYVTRPALFNVFWMNSYRPYYSPWYWDYYPTYYTYWAPYPVYRYRNHVHVHINTRNTYHYANVRSSSRAVAIYSGRRSDGYERLHPNTAFNNRNQNVSNRRELDQNRSSYVRGGSRSQNTRSIDTENTRRNTATRDMNQNNRNSFNNSSRNVRNTVNENNIRTQTPTRGINNSNVRSTNNVTRSQEAVRTSAQPARNMSAQQPARNYSAPATRSMNTPARQSAPAIQRNTTPAVRSSTPAPQRQSAPAPQRTNSNNAGRRG